MEFMQQTLDCPDLMARVVNDLTTEEKHLVHLELMIMEQVADWELDSGKVDSVPRKQVYNTRYVCLIASLIWLLLFLCKYSYLTCKLAKNQVKT